MNRVPEERWAGTLVRDSRGELKVAGSTQKDQDMCPMNGMSTTYARNIELLISKIVTHSHRWSTSDQLCIRYMGAVGYLGGQCPIIVRSCGARSTCGNRVWVVPMHALPVRG